MPTHSILRALWIAFESIFLLGLMGLLGWVRYTHAMRSKRTARPTFRPSSTERNKPSLSLTGGLRNPALYQGTASVAPKALPKIDGALQVAE